MPMGIRQNNTLIQLTMDKWNDQVFLNAQAYPAGYFACAAMNNAQDELVRLLRMSDQIGEQCTRLYKATERELRELLPALRPQAKAYVDLVRTFSPYDHLDLKQEHELLDAMLTADTAQDISDPDSEGRSFCFFFLRAMLSIPFGLYHFLCFALPLEGNYLRRLKRRDETYFAVGTHDYFHSEEYAKWMPEYNRIPIETFTEAPTARVSYVFARNPKDEKKMVFVERMFFDHVIHFLTHDLFNGMHWGHAPTKCLNCGRFFLTDNAHTPQYCGEPAPQDSKYTCRQYGSMKKQKDQNSDHPVYNTFKTRTNTIRKQHERGKITDEVRDAALRLAEEYREAALLDDAYARGKYIEDMKQKNFEAELKRRLEQ